MNWNIFKKADVESKDRLKCSQCHVYLPDNYAEEKCQYCLGIRIRITKKIKNIALCKTWTTNTEEQKETLKMLVDKKCENCGAVVPGLISRYCLNCSIKAIHYG